MPLSPLSGSGDRGHQAGAKLPFFFSGKPSGASASQAVAGVAAYQHLR